MLAAPEPNFGRLSHFVGGLDARAPMLWLLLAMGPILSVVGCEYNADVVVRIPRWESAVSAVGVLGVHSRPATASSQGPFTAADCSQPPSRLAISFFLSNERGEAVREGDRLDVGGLVLHPSAAAMSDPQDSSQSVTVDLLSLDSGGDPVSLVGVVEEVTWIPTSSALPPRVVLLHDHSMAAAEQDPPDQRLAALSELVGEALCHDTMAARCPLPSSTTISLYRMDDGTVEPMVQTSRDFDTLDGALDVLRNEGERGDAPVLGSGGGVQRALAECSASSATPCWPAVVLIAGEANEPAAVEQDPSLFPESARIMIAGLSDSPALRRLACQTGGFFERIDRLSDLRLLTNRSSTDLPEYAFGFARKVLLAARGRWEVVLSVSGVPADLDMTQTHLLSGTLGVKLGSPPNEHTALAEFQVTIGGY